MDSATTSYLGDLVRVLSARLGPRMEAVALVGSHAAGGFVPGVSDIDVLAVSTRPLADGEKRALAAELSHERLPCPARKLELVLYARTALARPARRPRFELNLNTGEAGPDHVSTAPEEEPGHWFLLDLAAAREHAIPLLGPHPAELVAPLPRRWLLDALLESIDWHLANEPDSPNAVLNACRSWLYAAEGRWSSKDEAARWARRRLDDPSPVDRAVGASRGGGGLSEEEVAVLLRRVRHEVAGAG